MSIGTYDRTAYLTSKSYILRTRISSITSTLVHASNLRLSADEKFDFSQFGKCQLSETSQRRWLECNLTRVNFRTPCRILIVILFQTFRRHQPRLCMCYANLIAFFYLNVHFCWFPAKAQYAHHTPNYALSGFSVLLPPVSWFGWYFIYVGGWLCSNLHENTRVTCVWMLFTFLNSFCCFRLMLQIRGALSRRQLQNEACEIAKKCSTHQCQSNALICDDIHGCLHTIQVPWKCLILHLVVVWEG